MTTNIKIAEDIADGLNREQQEGVVAILATVLADQHVLYIKLRNFHWNLKGPRFHSLHEFFEKQYASLEVAIDDTAERIRMLGGVSPGSMKEFLAVASLKEVVGGIVDGNDAIEALVADHETTIRYLRKSIFEVEQSFNDVSTADFLINLLHQHEQDAWMLRSFNSK